MTTMTSIGRHRASRDRDFMRMTMIGPLTRSDGEGMRAMMEDPAYAGTRCYFLADMTDCTGIDAEARKYMAAWSKEGGHELYGVAAYGVSFALRAIISLTMSAIRFLGHHKIDIVFVKTEAEALKWVADHRAARGE